MSPTNSSDADVILFTRDDIPLANAWERLKQAGQDANAFMYMWSESQRGKLQYLHHFKHTLTRKYIEVEA